MIARPTCPRCNGAKTIEAPAFRSTSLAVERTCHVCKGKGTIAYPVDAYDVIEWLLTLPEGVKHYPSDIACSIVEKWGAK